VARAREAWKRRKANANVSWAEWVVIGEGLCTGREQVMAAVNAKKPTGKKYNVPFGQWLQINELDDIDGSDRNKLMKLMGERDALEAWRASLTDAERERYNHPSTVWRAWKCPDRGGRWRDEQANGAEPNGARKPEESEDEYEGVARHRELVEPTNPTATHQLENNKRWLRAVLEHTNNARKAADKAAEYAAIAGPGAEVSPELRQALRQVVDPTLVRTLLQDGAAICKDGAALLKLAVLLKEVITGEEPCGNVEEPHDQLPEAAE
jgi:hypothetical protein